MPTTFWVYLFPNTQILWNKKSSILKRKFDTGAGNFMKLLEDVVNHIVTFLSETE